MPLEPPWLRHFLGGKRRVIASTVGQLSGPSAGLVGSTLGPGTVKDRPEARRPVVNFGYRRAPLTRSARLGGSTPMPPKGHQSAVSE